MSSELSVALQRCLLGGKSGAGDIQFYYSQLSLCLLSHFEHVLELILLLIVVGLWLKKQIQQTSF